MLLNSPSFFQIQKIHKSITFRMLNDLPLSPEDQRGILKKDLFSPSPEMKRRTEEETVSEFSVNESIEPTTSKRVEKRKDALSWDDYFMSVAFLSAMRSKDPSTQVGACIVNEDKRIVGIGYNGFPRGCSDDELPWDRDGEDELETKYPVIS